MATTNSAITVVVTGDLAADLKVKATVIDIKCRKCGKPIYFADANYTRIDVSRELVIVDKDTNEAWALNEGDQLHTACLTKVAYYRRVTH